MTQESQKPPANDSVVTPPPTPMAPAHPTNEHQEAALAGTVTAAQKISASQSLRPTEANKILERLQALHAAVDDFGLDADHHAALKASVDDAKTAVQNNEPRTEVVHQALNHLSDTLATARTPQAGEWSGTINDLRAGLSNPTA